MTNAILCEKSEAGNPHVWFDEGGALSFPREGRPEAIMRGAKPRCRYLLESVRAPFAAVLLLSCAVAEASNDDLPDSFDALTGYVTRNDFDSFSTPVPCDTAFCLARGWSDGQVPHSGTNYFVGSAYTPLYTPFYVTKDDVVFKGDKLVIGPNAKLQHLTGGSSNIDLGEVEISDLYMLGGSALSMWGVKNIFRGNIHIRRCAAGGVVTIDATPSSEGTQPFKSNFDGDANQTVKLTKSSGGLDALTFEMRGDFSGYKGLLVVRYPAFLSLNAAGGVPARVRVSAASSVRFNGGELQGLAGVELEPDGRVEVPANGLLTVGDFVAGEGAKLDLKSAGSTLVVTQSVRLAGQLQVNVSTVAESDDGGMLTFVRFASGVDIDGMNIDSFKVSGIETCTHSELGFVVDADGASLVLKTYPVISHCPVTSDSAHSDFLMAQNASGSWLWTNQSAPALDAEASDHIYRSDRALYLPNSSGMVDLGIRDLVLESGSWLWNLSGCSGLSVPITAKGMHIQTIGGPVDATERGLDGTALGVFRLCGSVKVIEGSVNTFLVYGNTKLNRYESEISGCGDIKLTTYPSAGNPADNSGYHDLTALNTNWSGKVAVTVDYHDYPDRGVTTPNDGTSVRVFVSDGRNLGGSRAAFAHDALFLEHHSLLIARQSLTFEDGVNRGIKIGDVGAFFVPAGAMVNVARPLTLSGCLVKEGEGVLKLSGMLRFAENDDLADSRGPTTGKNVLQVRSGGLEAGAMQSVDGAAVEFASGSKLIVDASATGDLARYGFYDVRGSIAAEGGVLNVGFDVSALDEMTERTLAVCTVAEGSAVPALRFDRPWPNFRAKALPSVTADGLTTYSVKILRMGLIIHVR